MPVEIGRYANPELNGLPRAYNNLVLDGGLVYIAVDYCGLEVLDVSDPAQISLVGWWNPWDCQGNPLNWFSSPGHANEIAFDADCQTLFLSTGKSDMHAIDISDPAQPDSCFSYGGVSNDIGTWGVSIYDDNVFLSYICAIIPFVSNWTGVKILEYGSNCVNAVEEAKPNILQIHPNPATDQIAVDIGKDMPNGTWRLFRIDGVLLKQGVFHQNNFSINTNTLSSGVYFFEITNEVGMRAVERFLKSE